MAVAPLAWDAEVLPVAKAMEAKEGMRAKLPTIADIIIIAAVLFACMQVERDSIASVN